MTKRKTAQAGAVVALAAAILLAGTFAWSNFTQSRVNTFKELMTPDVNLHDDFEGGPNKDVYVENSGQKDIFVRVKMTEYLQTASLGSLALGHTADQENLWVPHNTVQAVSEGTTTYDPNQCDIEASGNQVNPQWTNAAGQDFHDFYTWTLGGQEGGNADGQIYYKPAPEDKRAQVDANGNIIQEPQVVSDELTGTQGDAAAYYAQQLEGLSGDDLTAKMAELGVKQTRTAKVYTMDQWKNGVKTGEGDSETTVLAPCAQGDFWVIDTDGWAYWANPLRGGEATGLLLDKVTRTENKFDSDAEYKINVQLQAVTADDIAEFGTERGGGISKDALRMMKVASGTGVIGLNADGTETLFVKNADGTYTPTDPESGEVTDATAKYIFLDDTHSIQDGKALKIGDDLSFTELEWDGTDYTNFDAAQGAAPLFNMSKVADEIGAGNYSTAYQLTGAQVGVDGKTYLILQAYEEQGETDKTYAPAGEPVYLGAVDRQGEADSYTYSQTDPGKGPFAIIYPTAYDASGNAIIGTQRDLRVSPNVTILNRSFRLLGNGVYEETTETAVAALADGDEAVAKTFFFAGKYVTKSMFSGVNESNVTEKVNTVFPLQLTEGGWFTFGVNNSETGYTQVIGYSTKDVTSETTGAVQFETLEQGADGNYYIKLVGRKGGYIGPNDDGFLSAPSGGTTSDKRAWANPATGLPIGSVGANGDVFTQPEDFTETFLKGKTSEELSTPGTTFTVNGYEFVVLDADQYGNRFIMTTGGINIGTPTSSRTMPVYAETNWVKNGSANAFLDNVPNLKTYVISANLPPNDPIYPEDGEQDSGGRTNLERVIADRGEGGAYKTDVSTAVYSTAGTYRAFPLSVEEYLRFIYLKDGTDNNTPDMTRFRTAANGGSVFRNQGANKSSPTVGQVYIHQSMGYITAGMNQINARMGMWVRFSDADSIATATANELAAWKAAGKVAEGGATMTVGKNRYGILTVQDGKAKVGYFGDYVTYSTGKTVVTNWWKGLSGEDAEIKDHAYMPDSTAEIKGSLTQDVTSATSSRPGAGECAAFIPLYQDLYPSALNDTAVKVWTRSLNAGGNQSYICRRDMNPPYDLLDCAYNKYQILSCVWVDWDWAMTKLN